MDIIRGSLDGISRPASHSRIHSESRSSSTSLEVLTPEPVPFKVDISINLSSSSQQSNRESYNSKENSNTNGEKKRDTQKVKTPQDYSSEVGHHIYEQIKSSCTQYSETNSSLIASEDEYEVQYFRLFDIPQEIPNEVKEEVFKLRESDLQLQEAVKKMKRLDKLLVEKQCKEREIKKQGQEMRLKLWEQLQTITNFDAIRSNEEIENTKKFLALTSSEGTTEQEEPFVSVFHTQIPSEEYENYDEQVRQESAYQSEDNKSVVKSEKKPQREKNGEFKGKKNQDFIKRNIELAKDSKNVVGMVEREKQRLTELLRDIENGDDTPPDPENGESDWLVPEKGYMSAAHRERQQLAQIDSKLQEQFSLTSSEITHDCSVPNQIGQQETLLNDNKHSEVTPGEKALQTTKEHRYETIRIKEIDQQLRDLENDFLKTTQVLSAEQLKTLLKKCILEQRSEKESRYVEGIQCESIEPSRSFLSRLLSVSPALGSPEVENDDIVENKECETPGYYLSKALDGQHHIAEFLVTEIKEVESLTLEDVATSDMEDYFMSKAHGIGRLKRPSFLDDPLYCMSIDSGPLSEDNDLKLTDCPTESPLKSGTDELMAEEKTEGEDRDS